MKFSIRLLLTVMLLAALVTQAAVSKIEVESLETLLALEMSDYQRLELRARPLRRQADVSAAVLEDYKYTSQVYLAAKKRFKLWQLQKAN